MTQPRPIRTVICAVDFSAASLRAAEEAQRVTQQLGAVDLVLLHVHVPEDSDPANPTGDAEARLASLAGALPECMIERRLMSVRGETVQTILRVAKEEEADMLVMGTEGKTGIRRTLFGSVAENVLRGADIPVLVVRGPR